MPRSCSFFEKGIHDCWIIKKLNSKKRCPDYISPWCIKHNGYHREYDMIIDDIADMISTSNCSKQFRFYKSISLGINLEIWGKGKEGE